jgi:hypothetical protein
MSGSLTVPLSGVKPAPSSKALSACEPQRTAEKGRVHKLQPQSTYISDLYERMGEWRVLCRVINLRKFTSKKGKKCIMMYLIDQKGDTIKAMHFSSPREAGLADSWLEENAVYSFSGGEVKEEEDSNTLGITFDSLSQIGRQKDAFIYPFCHKRLCMFKDLPHKNESLNVIGVLKSYEILRPYNEKPKLRGILCSVTEFY